MWRAWDEPPTIDHRPSLNAWRIEESLEEWCCAEERHEYYEPFIDRTRNRAAATVQIVTGLDRDASRQALEKLSEMQDEIDNEVFGPLIYQAREAYEAALMALGSMAGVNA